MYRASVAGGATSAEDDVASLQIKLQTLESKHKTLLNRALDLESCSRRNNLRLIGLPEGVEGRDPCYLFIYLFVYLFIYLFIVFGKMHSRSTEQRSSAVFGCFGESAPNWTTERR